MKKTYMYEYKNVLYFRKRIAGKYLLSSKDYILRKSLKIFLKEHYFILLNNNLLDKLTSELNESLNIYLIKKRKSTLNDILEHLQVICADYIKEAIIENSVLEKKRIDYIDYIDDNGFHQGYQLQALSKYYKKILSQYENLSSEEKTIELGTEIIKRSNISKEEILSIAPSNLIDFYELLIKSEKKILENDIKLYISRNLSQFKNLFDIKSKEEDKISEAYYNYINLIRENKPQKNYLSLLKKTNEDKTLLNSESYISREDIQKLIINELKNISKEKQENQSKFLLSELKRKFLEHKNLSEKREKSFNVAISFFEDFCRGNNTSKYQQKEINKLTFEDFSKFEKLLINACPKSKSTSNLNLYELVDKRSISNLSRYSVNTMDGIENSIKQFYKYICKFHKYIGLDIDLIDSFNPKQKLLLINEKEKEEDPILRPFSDYEIQQILDSSFAKEKLHTILRDNQQKFFVFIICLTCGLRLEEALLISIDDIKVQTKNNEKIYYIYLCENKNFQHLKNSSAHRNIAITNFLKSLGLLNYIQQRIDRDKTTLFDFPKSRSASLAQFYQREFKKLFPERLDSRENRNNNFEEFVQFRSLRKNFTNILFHEDRTSFDNELNKKKILGHTTNLTGHYYGRIEPKVCFDILNSINFNNYFNFEEIQNTVSTFYQNLLNDLDIEEISPESWRKNSKVSARRGQKI